MNSNSAHLCRLCLESSTGVVNVCEKFQDSTIASVLAEHFWFQDDKKDGAPEWVCVICWNQTKAFHLFFKRVELRQQNSWSAINLASATTADEMKLERSFSPIQQPLEVDSNIVEDEEETDDKHSMVEVEGCDEDTNDRSSDESETKLFIQNPKNEKFLGKKLHNPDEIARHDAEIGRFFTMRCEMCSDTELGTLTEVRKHYRRVHQTQGYLTCCETKYSSRWLMLSHIQYHLNPNSHRCDQCGKICRDRKLLRLHITAHRRGRDHKCSLCSKTYKTAAALRYHVEYKHYTESSAKYTCDPCGKTYRTKLSLTAHMKNIHEFRLGHVCEVCGRTFKTKSDLEYHIQMEHSTTPPPKAQCNICGTWSKSKRALKLHLRIYHKKQEAQILSCPMCKKEVKSKRLLNNHIRLSHGERKHQCTFCEKSFRMSTALKEHVAIHTGADLYCCPYCDRTFKSGANMYSHRKKAHLAEWTRDKVEKNTVPHSETTET